MAKRTDPAKEQARELAEQRQLDGAREWLRFQDDTRWWWSTAPEGEPQAFKVTVWKNDLDTVHVHTRNALTVQGAQLLSAALLDVSVTLEGFRS